MIDIISKRKEEPGFGEGRGETEGMQGGAKNKADLVQNEQDEGKLQQRSFKHKEGDWEFYKINHVFELNIWSCVSQSQDTKDFLRRNRKFHCIKPLK